MDKDKIDYIEPPKISEPFTTLLDEMVKIVTSDEFKGRMGLSNYIMGRGSDNNSKGFRISPHNYAPPTIVGVQMQLERSEKLLTNHLKAHRTFLPIEFPQIVICEHVPKKIVYLRPLRRKSSRRWVKKWTKRGWKTEVDQMLKVGGTMIMSQELHDRMWQTTREELNRKLQQIQDVMQQQFMNEFWRR